MTIYLLGLVILVGFCGYFSICCSDLSGKKVKTTFSVIFINILYPSIYLMPIFFEFLNVYSGISLQFVTKPNL